MTTALAGTGDRRGIGAAVADRSAVAGAGVGA
jgi:hypothetical protein